MEKTTLKLKQSGFYAAPDFVQYEIRTEKGFAASELDFTASDYKEGESIY